MAHNIGQFHIQMIYKLGQQCIDLIEFQRILQGQLIHQ